MPDDLSGKAGRGRIGLIDHCNHCSGEYQVKAWNQLFCCADCAAKSKGFDDDVKRRTAAKRGRKT